jgi:hypothetical protein
LDDVSVDVGAENVKVFSCKISEDKPSPTRENKVSLPGAFDVQAA